VEKGQKKILKGAFKRENSERARSKIVEKEMRLFMLHSYAL